MRNSAEVEQVVRQTGARWSDEHIAATLNCMGAATPFGHTWDAKRVGVYRRTKDIPGYESAAGYHVALWFLALPSFEAALARVAQRVLQGGQHIPDDVVRRRFVAGKANLEGLYKGLVDAWVL